MVPEGTTSALTRGEVQDMRRDGMKAAVQQHLQQLLVHAAELRKLIDNAKTNAKKAYYQKKIGKLNGEVMQMVVAMQRLEAQHAAVHEPTVEHSSDDAPQTNESTTAG